jgi:uncharacterized membrane protein (UPF0127 family)
MKKLSLYNLIHIIFAVVLAAPLAIAETGTVIFKHNQIVINTTNGKRIYNVKIAKSEKQLEHGLMHRAKLAENEGMLFIFPKEQEVTMWMKNTPIPLDMLFIDKQGKVIYIKHNATPESLDHISAGNMPVRAVLELKAGIADKDRINIGDKVNYKAFTQ